MSFPFVLLPVWFAVKHGLRPLQRLADHIAARGANELSPIGLAPKYAELKPLVAALERLLQPLRHKLERERAFVQDAAHELRTPMAVIAAQAHALVGAANSHDREQAQAQLVAMSAASPRRCGTTARALRKRNVSVCSSASIGGRVTKRRAQGWVWPSSSKRRDEWVAE